MLGSSADGGRFRPNATGNRLNRTRRWRAVGLLMALCSAAALAYAYAHEAQANQQLRIMLKALSQAPGRPAVAAGNSKSAQVSSGAGGMSNGQVSGSVKALLGSLLPSEGDECQDHAALYPTIMDDLVPWMGRGITREDFDACEVFGFKKEIGKVYVGHFAIIDNVIYCVNPPMLEWVNPLYFLSLADIQETVLRYGVPDLEFRLQFTDWPQIPISRDFARKPMGTEPACPMFSWVKNDETMDILIPDGEFFKHHFDEWAANNSVNEPGAWASKAETAVGRYTNFPSGLRAASRRGEVVVPRDFYSELADGSGSGHLDVGMVEKAGFLPVEQQLNYKYALTVDGNTASTRLAMVLATEQVTLKHVSNYRMYYEAALQPWVHFVPVGRYDAKDIMPIIEWLRAHDDDARRIALAGQAFAQRHLTRPGRACYLRELLHKYGSLHRFKPELGDYANYSRLEDEFRQYNDTNIFHTRKARGDGWAQFFPWRKEDLDRKPHAALPVA